MAALRHKKGSHLKVSMKIHHKARKEGGSVKENEYNAVGSPEQHEAHEKNDGFKKGGKAKKKSGGHVEAAKSHHRLDKKPRRAAGGPVFSSASKKTMAEKDEAGKGHEGDGPKGEDPDRGGYKRGGCATGGKPEKWIAGAIKHEGALTRSAKKSGESVHKFAEEHKHASGKTGARSRLALTLGKMHKKG